MEVTEQSFGQSDPETILTESAKRQNLRFYFR